MEMRNTVIKKDNIIIFEQYLPAAGWFACDCFLFTLLLFFLQYVLVEVKERHAVGLFEMKRYSKNLSFILGFQTIE